MLSDAFYRAGVWKAGDLRAKEGLPTGFPVLDSVLPSKGWPKDSLTEVLVSQQGIGALRLLLPSLAAVSHQQQWLIWVCPPHIPYVPALQANNINLQQLLIIEPENEESADSDYKLWVFEQALRFQQCGIAMVWLDDVPSVSLRRLQLSCEAGKTCGVIFRPERFATEASPASLRVKVDACKNGTTSVHILKARGLTRERTLEINDL
jgi:hypothetical protein